MRPRTIVQALASVIGARQHCIVRNNIEWRGKHETSIQELVDLLPYGSGIDGRREIDLDKSTPARIVIHVEYHHMNDVGYYDGWTSHTITVRPAFEGIDLTISGPNRNDVKEYLADSFHAALTAKAPAEFQPLTVTKEN